MSIKEFVTEVKDFLLSNGIIVSKEKQLEQPEFNRILEYIKKVNEMERIDFAEKTKQIHKRTPILQERTKNWNQVLNFFVNGFEKMNKQTHISQVTILNTKELGYSFDNNPLYITVRGPDSRGIFYAPEFSICFEMKDFENRNHSVTLSKDNIPEYSDDFLYDGIKRVVTELIFKTDKELADSFSRAVSEQIEICTFLENDPRYKWEYPDYCDDLEVSISAKTSESTPDRFAQSKDWQVL